MKNLILVLFFAFVLSDTTNYKCSSDGSLTKISGTDDENISIDLVNCNENSLTSLDLPNKQLISLELKGKVSFALALTLPTSLESLTMDSLECEFPITNINELTSLRTLEIKNGMTGTLNFNELGYTLETVYIYEATGLSGLFDASKVSNLDDSQIFNTKLYGVPPNVSKEKMISKFNGNCFAYDLSIWDEVKTGNTNFCPCESYNTFKDQCSHQKCYYEDNKCTKEKPAGLSTAMIAIIIAVPSFVVIVGIIIAIIIIQKRRKANDVRADRYELEKSAEPEAAVQINNLESTNVTAASVF